MKGPATPRFCKAHSVPYTLRDKEDVELSRLVEEGTCAILRMGCVNCSGVEG